MRDESHAFFVFSEIFYQIPQNAIAVAFPGGICYDFICEKDRRRETGRIREKEQ